VAVEEGILGIQVEEHLAEEHTHLDIRELRQVLDSLGRLGNHQEVTEEDIPKEDIEDRVEVGNRLVQEDNQQGDIRQVDIGAEDIRAEDKLVKQLLLELQ
jgi:hypothetical protein